MKRSCPFDNGTVGHFKMRKSGEEKEMEALDNSKGVADEQFAKTENLKQAKITSYMSCDNINLSHKNCVTDLNETVDIWKCFYCDSASEIIYKCHVCLEDFCHPCSLPVYDVNGEHRICTSCY